MRFFPVSVLWISSTVLIVSLPIVHVGTTIDFVTKFSVCILQLFSDYFT